MPALEVIRCCGTRRRLTTRPFAGDDLQVLCVLLAAYRVVQIACIVPFWVKAFLFRLHGNNFVGPYGRPSWCVDVVNITGLITDQAKFVDSANDASPAPPSPPSQDGDTAPFSVILAFTCYMSLSVLYNLLDIGLSMGVWSAAGVGTPTEPQGRDGAVRKLIWVKIVLSNFLLVLVLGSGLYLVAEGRRTNYGCGEGEDEAKAVQRLEGTAWYAMFCVVTFTYAFELLLTPCFIVNQLGKSISSDTSKFRLTEIVLTKERRRRNTAACIGGCFKCLQCLSCNRLGGGKIRADTDLKDAAVALMDFFNFNAKFDITLSDVWLAFKMLGRVHRERKYKLSQQARMDKKTNSDEQLVQTPDSGYSNGHNEFDWAEDPPDENNNLFLAEDNFLIQNDDSYPSFADEDGIDNATRKTVLRPTRASDMHHIRQAARYSHYACGVYDFYPDALLAAGLMIGGRSGAYHPTKPRGESRGNVTDGISLFSCFRLTEFGLGETALVYGTFANDTRATPYCILVDEQARAVVVSIRGTATLEDMVSDLQWDSVAMDRVGEVCGFDGKDKYAHRGMLTKSKWIYNDLTKRKILAKLLPTDDTGNSNNPCYNFNLIFTGHSLGAGIAAVLSTMFKPKYPALQCYAFCPPGCSVSINLAFQCKDYVTSIVVGNDLIPRTRASNFEMLRFEFLEVLARVKVPKIKAWRDIRRPCKNKDLVVRNKRLLYAKNEIPASDYFEELQSFQRNRTRSFYEAYPIETCLNIPGRIIHLVRAVNCSGITKYIPYWESSRSLREINLSLEVIKEHSMDNLVIILKTLANDFENASKGVVEDEDNDDDSVEPVEHHNYDECLGPSNFSSDHRWFILCSRPHGLAPLIPLLLVIAAFFCGVIGNNICSLFIREVEDGELFYEITTGVVEDVAGISFGLYSYGTEYYHGDIGEYGLHCAPTFPKDAENDVYIQMARGFSTLACLIGFPSMCLLGLANCMMLSRNTFRRISVALLFATCFQSLIFLFLLSERCHKDLFPNLHGVYMRPCHLDIGSKLAVSSTVMWFLAAVFTAHIDRASLIEAQLKMLSMHVTNRIND